MLGVLGDFLGAGKCESGCKVSISFAQHPILEPHISVCFSRSQVWKVPQVQSRCGRVQGTGSRWAPIISTVGGILCMKSLFRLLLSFKGLFPKWLLRAIRQGSEAWQGNPIPC